MKELDQAIREKWKNREADYIDRSGSRGSSVVLIPLIKKASGYEVLFEVRSHRLTAQPGEVCFPGGGAEPGEKPEETAVRETMEELLLRREQIEVLAPMDIMTGPGGAPLRSYIGLLHAYQDTYSIEETDHIFTVPLKWFLEHEPEVYQTRLVTVADDDFPYDLIPGGRNYNWKPTVRNILFYRNEHAVIWGITAALIHAAVQHIREEILTEEEIRC